MEKIASVVDLVFSALDMDKEAIKIMTILYRKWVCLQHRKTSFTILRKKIAPKQNWTAIWKTVWQYRWEDYAR